MNDMLIPNWHPMLVHFTVALITISAIFFVVSRMVKDNAETFVSVAKWMLWVGAGITVLTVIAGFDAYNSVMHDDVAHEVMKVHRTWALATSAAILVIAIWVWQAKAISMTIVAMSVILAGMVGATGYLGAELVYRHGLGVMRLPEVAGVGHEHEGGGDHDHDAATKAIPKEEEHEHAEGEGHKDPEVASKEKEHEHADGETHEAVLPATLDPAGVSDALFAALKRGDAEAVSSLLADDVMILEGGHAQISKADYMAGHMVSDMAFLAEIQNEVLSREASEAGDIAWVTTHTRSSGFYKRKPINSASREFLLMKRTDGAWKITHIQWGKN